MIEPHAYPFEWQHFHEWRNSMLADRSPVSKRYLGSELKEVRYKLPDNMGHETVKVTPGAVLFDPDFSGVSWSRALRFDRLDFALARRVTR